MAGAGTDTSGTSTDQLGVLLTEIQEKKYNGAMFVGVPGAAKSACAKAIGNEMGIITIKLDLGGMKHSLVGFIRATYKNGYENYRSRRRHRWCILYCHIK